MAKSEGKQEKRDKPSFRRAAQYACTGIVEASHERNFRIELGFAFAAVVLNLVFRVDGATWMATMLCIGFVLAGEAMNTAIEAVVDLASPQHHELARIAKDCAAGAVLIGAATAFVIACLAYIPPFLALAMRFF